MESGLPDPHRSGHSGDAAADGAAGRVEPAKLTIRDVAVAAGVSPATVSRALRGMDIVDSRTRERIVAVARSMNYAISPAASRLATGRTGTIGIVTPFIGRWYFTEVFAGIEQRLKDFDVDLLIHTTEEMTNAGLPAAAERMRRRVDGALIVGMSPSPRDWDDLSAIDVPVVLLGARRAGLSSVDIDNRRGAQRAVQHLVDTGHTRIGLVTGRALPTPILPENARLSGYLAVLKRHGLEAPEELRQIGGFTSEGGQVAMRRLLELAEPPTAVFAMSDEMAYGAIRELRAAGIPVGGDYRRGEIAIVGFDGHDLAEIFDLTTVAQPVRELGRQAGDLLMRHVQAGAQQMAQSLVLATHLQVRGSTMVPPNDVTSALPS